MIQRNFLSLLNKDTQAYFELGMDAYLEQPVIKFRWNIDNRSIKEILKLHQESLNWQTKQAGRYQTTISNDFPRPYTLEAIGLMGARKLNPNYCMGYNLIAYWVFDDPIEIQGLAKTAYVCYLLSEQKISEGQLSFFAKRIHDCEIVKPQKQTTHNERRAKW